MSVVHAYPRLHFGLLDLGNATDRRYGGAGLILDGPRLKVSATCERSDLVTRGLCEQQAQEDVRETINRFVALTGCPGIGVTIEESPPAHIGLGTKTALLMAVAVACDAAAGTRLTRTQLKALTARGGASGIGINGFFRGGLIVDAGQPSSTDLDFIPSSGLSPATPSLRMLRVSVPSHWVVTLLLPQGTRVSGPNETLFFRQNTPIPEIEVHLAISTLYHGIVPAVKLADLSGLKRSLYRFQSVGFKRREIEHQSPNVREVINALSEISNCAVGMSSLGPLVFCISSEDDSKAASAIDQVAMACHCVSLGKVRGRNMGCEIC